MIEVEADPELPENETASGWIDPLAGRCHSWDETLLIRSE
jgi:hypothetical protein